MGDVDALADLEPGDPLGAPGSDDDDAEERDADAKMGDRRAPGRARQSRGAKRHPQDHGALGKIDQRAGHDEQRKPDAKRRQHRAAMLQGKGGRDCHCRNERRGRQALHCAKKIAAFPAEKRPERHGQQQRHKQRAEGGVEERRPDGNLGAGQRFQRQRIKRANENRGAGAGQEQIIEDQRAFARDRCEQATPLEERRAPRIKRQRAANKADENRENENAAPRIGGEGMHRGEHARSHQEGADQRQREGEDREQDGPDLERAALLHDHGGMQQRGAASHGINEAFSTGSQNQYPPQPSS